MDNYTNNLPDLEVGNLLVGGKFIKGRDLISNIEKLQAVVEAARDVISGAVLYSDVSWIASNSTMKELQRRLEDLEPKTIQQLQDERNSAADAITNHEGCCDFPEAITAYKAAKAAHEAALARQTGG